MNKRYKLENYWKKIYQKTSKKKYEFQSFQSNETINWHKNYIEKKIFYEFNQRKPRVLDIGCCSGYITNLFSKFASDVVGVDYEKTFILNAKSKYPKIKFVKTDIYNLKKISGLFDLIVCFGVLQNITDLKLVLKNIKLKLRKNKNSKIIFTTINKNSILNRNHLLTKIFLSNNKKNFYFNFFSKEEYRAVSEQMGLRLVKYEHLFILPGILSYFSCFLRIFLPSSFSHHILVEIKYA